MLKAPSGTACIMSSSSKMPCNWRSSENTRPPEPAREAGLLGCVVCLVCKHPRASPRCVSARTAGREAASLCVTDTHHTHRYEPGFDVRVMA